MNFRLIKIAQTMLCDNHATNVIHSFFFLLLSQWMVDGQTGLRGHCVVSHAEMELSRERGNVPIHRLSTSEQDVRETPRRSDHAIWESVQVRER